MFICKASYAALTALVLMSAGCNDTEAEEPKDDQATGEVKKSDAEPKAGDIVEREDNPPVHYVTDDDPKMLAAIKRARETVEQFIDANKEPVKGLTGFSVKFALRDKKKEDEDEKSKAATNQVEHMWIGPVTYNEEDATFTGRLGNVPNRL
ncbi:MAG: DUF2314 domain-containing protein, partial [Pirellulales bacterium]|nr:DUF2314 domain-containing protein [Pirellulales bacterium]